MHYYAQACPFDDYHLPSYFSSNHQDAPHDILLTDVRLQQLSAYQRKKRKYNKKDTHYWEAEITRKQAKQ